MGSTLNDKLFSLKCTRENDQHKVKPTSGLEAPVNPWAALTCALVLRVFAIAMIVDPVQYLTEDHGLAIGGR